MSQILPNLHLGDREDSRDHCLLDQHGISHIVNCAAELPCCFPEDFRYLALALRDPDPRFLALARPAMKFIDLGRTAGGVLVHCTAGVSRSAAVVLKYLCHLGRPLDEACFELSKAVLTGIDEAFLFQIAGEHGISAPAACVKRLSLVLAGHFEKHQPERRV